MRKTEHVIQVNFFRLLKYYEDKYPELELVFAIPNESYGGGMRAIRRGMYFKAEGRKAGIPDVCLPVPRGGYGAFYIEFKAPKNYPTKKQKEWIEKLQKAGNRVEVCSDPEEALNYMIEYLGLERNGKIVNSRKSKK